MAKQSFLDRVTVEERKGYYNEAFIATERTLVAKRICSRISGGVVLNVGCGRNGTERRLFPDSFRVYGVDVDADSLRTLNSRRWYQGVTQGSIDSLPFATARIDVVYCRLMLHHLIFPRYLLSSGLAECFRVLKPGGILALVEPNSWHPLGMAMNLAHSCGIDAAIHGHDDDIALSPLMLKKQLLAIGAQNLHITAVSYNWRRLPLPVQKLINTAHRRLVKVSNRFPYLGHTLMMTAVK